MTEHWESAMRRSVSVLGATALALTLVGGCGITVRPHLGTRDIDQPAGVLPGGRASPRPAPNVGQLDETQPAVDQVCRVQPMRAGWIATSYLQGGDTCPESTDPENPYTVAVIERYSDKRVETTLMVCADQSIPRQWLRESNRDVSATCSGARVREGEPTVMVIRRVSAAP